MLLEKIILIRLIMLAGIIDNINKNNNNNEQQ